MCLGSSDSLVATHSEGRPLTSFSRASNRFVVVQARIPKDQDVRARRLKQLRLA